MNKTDFSIVTNRQSLMDSVIDSTENVIANLYSRWKDEREYEDFNEYKEVIRKTFLALLPKDSEIVSISKTFVIVLKIPGFPYKPTVRMKARSYGWSSK